MCFFFVKVNLKRKFPYHTLIKTQIFFTFNNIKSPQFPCYQEILCRQLPQTNKLSFFPEDNGTYSGLTKEDTTSLHKHFVEVVLLLRF